MAPKRPTRKKRGDRLLDVDARREEVMVDHAVAAFDRVATQAERKWGYDRLPELVAPELAAKYGGAIGYLNEAIRDNDADKAAAAAQNCIKGIEAMEAAATAAGHKSPEAIAHYKLDDFEFRIISDAADSTAIEKDGIKTFTLREIAIALMAQLNLPLIDAVKDKFPLSEVKSIKPKSPVDYGSGGDRIPF